MANPKHIFILLSGLHHGGWCWTKTVDRLYALATPFVLRPWFLAHDLLPHATGAIGSMIDADLYLNVWILAWIAHAALVDPSRIYDGNVFHPERLTLAYSEPMVVQAVFAMPILWAGASLVLAYNLLLLAGIALSGWTMALVMLITPAPARQGSR